MNFLSEEEVKVKVNPLHCVIRENMAVMEADRTRFNDGSSETAMAEDVV